MNFELKGVVKDRALHQQANIAAFPATLRRPVHFYCSSFSIVRVSHRIHGHQYAIRTRLKTGILKLMRIPGLYPTPGIVSFFKESGTYQKAASLLIAATLQDIVSNTTVFTVGKYPSIRAAAEAFLAHHAKTHRGNPRNIHCLISYLIKYCGDLYPSALTRKKVCEFADHLCASGYAPDTLRLTLNAGSNLIKFLLEEECWDGDNPFRGIYSTYSRTFPAIDHGNTRLPDVVWYSILYHAARPEYWAAALFIFISFYTGLRPHEVRRLDVRDIDRSHRTWRILVTKTAKRSYHRTIAIPQPLINYLDTLEATECLSLSETTVARQIRKLREEVGYPFVAKSFRKDFAARMEAAGAPPHIIDLHQGRGQTSVLHKSYITASDRPAKICRDHIDRMFAVKTDSCE